jgi:hypothetical protein
MKFFADVMPYGVSSNSPFLTPCSMQYHSDGTSPSFTFNYMQLHLIYGHSNTNVKLINGSGVPAVLTS